MALHFKRWDIKRLFTRRAGKTNGLYKTPGPVYGKFSVHETHGGHSPADDYSHRGGQRHCNLAIVLSSGYLGA